MQAPVANVAANVAAANANFGKSPAAVSVGRDLDMTNEEDKKLYYCGISRFVAKNELFDLTSGRFLTYMERLGDRATEFGWNAEVLGILNIPEDPLDAAGELGNLLNNYGMIPIERVRAFEETYIHLPIRAANDTDMLYKCQMASLTESALSTLLLKKDEYYVGDQPSGNLLLRVIIRESSLDNNANTSIIRTKLSKLDQYMPMCKGNIKEFNEYVQLQLHSLNARGETTDDLLVHLFAAYKVASDANFRQLAKEEEIKYERGEPMTARSLMGFMLSRWEIMKNKDEWEAPSQEEQQLMVMRAEIEELKNKKSAQAQPTTLMKKIAGKLRGKMQAAKKFKQYKGKTFQADPEWLAKNMKPNPLTKTMQHGNKAWHWCSPATGGKCDGNWRVHKPSQCKGVAGSSQNRHKAANSEGDEHQLRMMQALTSVLMENDDDELMDGMDD
jgi:hypothetical protein